MFSARNKQSGLPAQCTCGFSQKGDVSRRLITMDLLTPFGNYLKVSGEIFGDLLWTSTD